MTSNLTINGVDLDTIFIPKSAIAIPPASGGIWMWGHNAGGQLGLGDTYYMSSPVQVGTLTNWTSIDGGTMHTIAVKSDGSLWSWGYKRGGPLGLGGDASTSSGYVTSPTQVGALTDWKLVSCGRYHSTAIKTNGTLWTWGFNYYNALGLSDSTHRSSPTQVGSLTDWKQVACGNYHNIAIKTDGSLWGWGSNGAYNLGLGPGWSNQYSPWAPVQIGTQTDWQYVSCGQHYTLAIKTDGSLWSWGYNLYGQLGVENSSQWVYTISSPIQVGSLTTWQSITGGVKHTVAIKTDGSLWCWGGNEVGQLGLGDITHRSSPIQIGALNNWQSVSGGMDFTTAVKTDGTLWSWGNNPYGQLGVGDTTHRSSPVQVGARTNWKLVTGGFYHSIALAK
jgi:alpha-tubulin suppressor-like RCC1 family protein